MRERSCSLARDDDFGDGGFRAWLLAARQRGHSAVGRVFEARRTHIPVGDLLAHRRVLDSRAVFEFELRGQVRISCGTSRPPPCAAADREAFVHQRGQRDLPTLPYLAQALANPGSSHR